MDGLSAVAGVAIAGVQLSETLYDLSMASSVMMSQITGLSCGKLHSQFHLDVPVSSRTSGNILEPIWV